MDSVIIQDIIKWDWKLFVIIFKKKKTTVAIIIFVILNCMFLILRAFYTL